MLILSLSYCAAPEAVDALREPHMDWVAEGYARSLFLASGRKQPLTGGIILARGPRTEIEAFVATDPFVTGGVAQYDISEVAITRTAPGLEGLGG